MWNERYCGTLARRAGREDYQAWLLDQTERISEAAESDDLRPFWSSVRALQGERKRLVPPPVFDEAGNPATEPHQVAEIMAKQFCTEFGHLVKQGDVSSRSLHRGVECPVPIVADVPEALEPLVSRLKMEKTTGSDSVPNEILRVAGRNFIGLLADLVVRVLQEGAPTSWRGGTMTPVPKQAKNPSPRTMRRGFRKVGELPDPTKDTGPGAPLPCSSRTRGDPMSSYTCPNVSMQTSIPRTSSLGSRTTRTPSTTVTNVRVSSLPTAA